VDKGQQAGGEEHEGAARGHLLAVLQRSSQRAKTPLQNAGSHEIAKIKNITNINNNKNKK
jgi:hypothetical protein